MQNAQEFLPPESYTSKDQRILTTEYTDSTEEVKIFMFWFSLLFLCDLCVLCGSIFSCLVPAMLG